MPLDVFSALQLIHDAVTKTYSGIGNHRIGKTDLLFLLKRYQTYLTKSEQKLIDQSLRNDQCFTQAHGLLVLHSECSEWLVKNGFRNLDRGNIHVPHLWTSKKAKSFGEIVEVISQDRNRLYDEHCRAPVKCPPKPRLLYPARGRLESL